MLLSVKNLSYSHTFRPLIQNLSFHVNKKQFLWIKGDNGCGKTTLLHIIAGFLTPYVGHIIRNCPYHFIFSEPHLPPHTQTKSFVNLCASLIKGPQKKAQLQKALSILDIDTDYSHSIQTLSAGQKQKIFLLPLLLQFRPLWICDEPYNHLDHKSVRLFNILVQNHLSKDGSIIFTSHHPTSSHTHVLDLGSAL